MKGVSIFLLVAFSLQAWAAPEFKNSFGVPFPPVFHRVLDNDFTDKYDEIFVIGDVHGSFDQMDKLIEQIQAEDRNSRILKIFLGDMVRKGENSKKVIDYLMECEDCLAVRGNHEEKTMSHYQKIKNDPTRKVKKHNRWIRNLNQAEIDYLISLPYTISIPSANAVSVHAGLMPGMKLE